MLEQRGKKIAYFNVPVLIAKSLPFNRGKLKVYLTNCVKYLVVSSGKWTDLGHSVKKIEKTSLQSHKNKNLQFFLYVYCEKELFNFFLYSIRTEIPGHSKKVKISFITVHKQKSLNFFISHGLIWATQ